jgi:hypothetical protein
MMDDESELVIFFHASHLDRALHPIPLDVDQDG